MTMIYYPTVTIFVRSLYEYVSTTLIRFLNRNQFHANTLLAVFPIV